MNKELGLKLIITGDGKVAVQASKEVQAALAGVAAEAQKGGTASKQMAVDIERNSKTASASVDTLTASLKSMAVGTAGLVAAFYTIKAGAQELVTTAAKFDSINKSLEITSGSAAGAADSMAFLQATAQRLGTDLLSSANAFSQLQESAKGTGLATYQVEAIFTSVSQAMAALGKSSDDTSGALLAIGQMMSKGTVASEELRGQLGERLPGAFSAAAKAMGVTTEELSKMLEKGEVLAGDFLPKLAAVLDETYGNSRFDSIQNNLNRISTAFDNFVNSAADFLHVADAVKLAADAVTPDTLPNVEKHIAELSSANPRSGMAQQARLRELDAEYKKRNELIDIAAKQHDKKAKYDDYDLIISEGEAQASKSLKQMAADTKTLADKQTELKKITEQYLTPLEKYNKALAAAKSAGASPDLLNRITDDYNASNSKKSQSAGRSAASLIKKQQDDAEREFKKQQDRAQAMREGANPDVAFVANIEEYTKAYNRGAISIQDYVFWLTKLDDTRQQAKGGAPDTGWADITAIQDEVSLQRSQDATKGVDDYVKSLDRAKDSASALSDVSSSIFDGALGGVNLIAGAFNTLTKSIAETTKELEANHAARIANDAEPESDKKSANRIKIANEEKRLNNEQLKSSLSGIRQIASATGAMFKENTNARRAFNVIALAASVTERAADIAGLGIKASAAVLEQGKGDPYTAFARMAAMAAIVASVLSAAGAGTFQFGGSSVPKGQVPTSPDSGTVLGDPAAKSESISKTYQLLKDIHATEYRELRGINSGVAMMNKGITDSITKLFQAGGLQTPNIAGLGTKMSGIGSFLTSIDPVNKMGLDPIGKFILKGLFGTTKTSITGGGIYAGGNSLASILNGGDISAQQYTEITKTKKSWFSKSSKVSEVMGPVNADFQDSLSMIFRGMGTSMLAMSNEFGDDMTKSINDYVIPKLKISLYGMSSEQMITTLNNVLSTQLDTMTSAIFGSLIKKYQKLGEGMFETATRLVSEKAIVLDAIDLVGSSFKGDAIDMADGLVQLAGGIKEFQAQFDDYYRKFYSESEQLANTTRRLTASLADMNITLPDSRNAYRDLVNVQQLDTEAGRERYDQLLKLSTAADTYYASMEKLRESMKLLTQDNFKSAVDYKRYLGLASLSGIKAATDLLPANPNTTFMPTGSPNHLLPGIANTPMTTAFTTVAESNNAVANEVKQLRIEQQAQALAIAQNTADMARLLKRWEGDGLPATRVIA